MMPGQANNVATTMASVIHTTHKVIETILETTPRESSPFAMSDKKILEEIYTTHVHADDSFDDDSLFVIVENILKHAIQTVDEIVLRTEVHEENIEEKTPKASFRVPLCTLKGVSFEMQCKPPGEEIAHKTTLAILNKLSNYSWEAKASLTLAAFAMDYGQFWLLARLIRQSDHLAKSIAILNGVPLLLKPSEPKKRKQSILDLNNLIKATLQVIEFIDQFNNLSVHNPKDVPDWLKALDHIPVYVYWAIMAVVACATKVTILTSDEDKEFDLSPYSEKIRDVLKDLQGWLRRCRKQIEEAVIYRRLIKMFHTPTEIMEVFKVLIFTKDSVQLLIDGSTKQTVNIDIIRRKNVLLFISSLDIMDDDISILKSIHEFTKNNQYKIVWIPIVEQWTDDLRKKFDILKNNMLCFTVQYPGPIPGIKFIKEEWNFKGKPTVVVIDPQANVEHPNALHIIRVWGEKAFPFSKTREKELSYSIEENWVVSVVEGIHPSVIKEDKYIFFYGGKDNEWIQEFSKKAAALASDPIFIEPKIHIESLPVGKDSKGEDDHGILGRFWATVESLFFTKVHNQVDSVSQEIQKFLSYKNESGWAVLSKGSTVLVTGPGDLVLEAVEDFEKWKDSVKKKEFGLCFKDYYGEIIKNVIRPACYRLDIPGSNGKVPETMKCPDCDRSMETFISYKCCHIDGPNAHH